MRLNSDFYFAKADMYHDDTASFNKQFESEIDMPYDMEEGLVQMLDEFNDKSIFLQGVKDNNKVCNKQRGPKS